MAREYVQGSLKSIQFDLLSDIPHLVHGSFSRLGGVSTGPLTSLNVSVSVGDDLQSVSINREKIRSVLGCDRLEFLTQVHGKKILSLDRRQIQDRNGDGMMTSRPGLGIVIQHADCQAALFYDPMHKVIGNVHAGWRGNVQNIYAEMIARMHGEFGTQARDLLVCISPSLGPKASEFKNYKLELPESFWRFEEDPSHFNLWEIARWQLQEAGVLSHHIEIAERCTYSCPEEWFSYRKNQVCGRNATVIALYRK